MFAPASRYFTIQTAILEPKDGEGEARRIAYKRRRLIPRAAGQTTLVEHTVLEGDRLVDITARYPGARRSAGGLATATPCSARKIWRGPGGVSASRSPRCEAEAPRRACRGSA
jgi:hypothetical protein